MLIRPLLSRDSYLFKVELGVESSGGDADQIADFHGIFSHPTQQVFHNLSVYWQVLRTRLRFLSSYLHYSKYPHYNNLVEFNPLVSYMRVLKRTCRLKCDHNHIELVLWLSIFPFKRLSWPSPCAKAESSNVFEGKRKKLLTLTLTLVNLINFFFLLTIFETILKILFRVCTSLC